MKYWEHIASYLDVLPARRVTWSLVLLFSAWVLLDVFVLQLTRGLSQSSFDAMVRARLETTGPPKWRADADGPSIGPGHVGTKRFQSVVNASNQAT